MGKNKRRKSGQINPEKNVIFDWISKFGLTKENIKKVENISELRETPPNLIVADCIRSFKFNQNKFTIQGLKKKNKYIMSLKMFEGLWCEKSSKRQLLKPGVIKFKNIYKPYFGHDLNNKKILFLRHGGIGDLIFIGVILRYLKKEYPTCHITFAAGPQYQPMLKDWSDLIDDLVLIPMNTIKFMKYDYHAIFEGVIERNKEAEKVNCYRLFSKWLNLNIPDDQLIPKQVVNKDKLDECHNILANSNLTLNPFILVQMRASSPIRTPNPLFWGELLTKLIAKGYNIILTDSPHESTSIDKFILKHFTDEEKKSIFNFSKFSKSINYSIALTSLSLIVLATDSALLHIAASLNKPLFGIYGPFKGELRLGTYKNADWIDAKCDCAPCFIHGYKPCINSTDGFPKCFDNIDTTEVVERMEKLLNV